MESPQPSPPGSPRRPPSPSELYPPTRFFPFPSGTYTVLPLVQGCDNFTLPNGPWEAADCRKRFDMKKGPSVSSGNGLQGSALDDDDDDDEDDVKPQNLDDDFLAPFFVSLPFDGSAPPTSATPPSTSRRSSSSASLNGRPSFSRLTPMPSLRSTSPTPSNSADHLAKPAADGGKREKAQPIGFLRPAIVKALVDDQRKMIAMNCRPPWAFLPPLSFPPPVRRPSRSYSRRGSTSATPHTPGTPDSISRRASSSASAANGESDLKSALEGLKMSTANGNGAASVLNNEDAWKRVYAVGFADWVNEEGKEARREHMDRLVRKWKMSGEFPEVLRGWRDEEYDIYGPAASVTADSSPLPGGNVVFSMERSACALFGVATFGVHMTAYIEEEGQPLKLWVPRRSATKQTWPGYLDNTVAGGISAGAHPYSTILRESIEEASLPPAFVASRIRAASALVYNYRTKDGWIQPEVQYVYDLKMDPPSVGQDVVKPGVNDSEVEEFMLMDLEEVVKRMCDGEFKPNCALVLVDFFIRHGYLTPESDARYLDVAMGCRRTLGLPGPA